MEDEDGKELSLPEPKPLGRAESEEPSSPNPIFWAPPADNLSKSQLFHKFFSLS